MNFKSESGKIYDTIFFFIEYFNKSEIEKEFKKAYNDTDFMFECYQKIESRAGEIPDLLFPLFFIADKRVSPISTFFSIRIDFKEDDIDSFILKLTTNSDILYQNTVDNIFSDYAKGESKKLMPAISPSNYIEAINEIDLPTDFKLQLSLLLGNFNYAISILAVYLKKIYALVDKLHNEYGREITLEYEQIQSPVNLQLYKNELQYNEKHIENTIVSISLLNQYFIYAKNSNSLTFFLFGLRHEEAISDSVDNEKATAENFILTCGSEVRMKIVKALIDNDEMTSSQIARYIDCPVTTMIRHISTLQDNGIIYISKRDKLQIFYRLNDKLLRRIKISIDDMFSSILNKKGKVKEDENDR